MLSDDLSLKDSGGVAKTFSRQSQLSDRSVWIDQASTATEPRLIKLSHRKEALKGKAGEYQDRHTCEFSVTKKDAVTGKFYTGICTVALQFPQSGVVTRAEMDHLLYFAALSASTFSIFSTVATVDKIYRSEL